MGSGRSNRALRSSSSSTGLRIQSTRPMTASMVARDAAELPSSSFCTLAFDMEYRKKSRSPGTTASQPSDSMTSTTWLFAVGWNLTRISPTTPTRGLVPSPTSGSVSNARIASRESRVNERRVNLGASLRARSMNSSKSAFAEPGVASYGRVR